MPEPQHFVLKPSAGIPNNPRLPVLVYRAGLPPDPARIEAAFDANGWEPRWRDGIFEFHHFHTTTHEALAVARGTARIILGGEGGQGLTLSPGDVAILPAGTGHRRIEASPDFLVVGAYPPGQDYEIEKPDAAGLAEATARIREVPLPESDPVTGPDGALMRLWKD